MAGKGEGAGEGTLLKLENQIMVIKYTLLFTNVILWMIGAAIFALTLWMRFEPGLEEWIQKLDLHQFYNGVYLLLVAAILMMIISFVGCISSLQENQTALLIYVGSQALGFVFGGIGSAFLLENSARDSLIQPLIKESMRRLIMYSREDYAQKTLAMIQESIGCCGAEGAHDYLNLRQPLPTQCRDTVTGNPFFYGCVDELTWYFEEKAAWVTGLTMAVCFLLVCNAVMAIILIQAIKKEQEESTEYRR
ncbi:hypothetical protein PPYR_06758 [Photinus pyralis]|uniref:Tetraspanin n=1 Tax=Photinus pyralis TaxID=7054 RepID=A0A1Y1NBM0_PHOPY|nr:tetraspanin-2A [Photinus pyralis]KAB0798878.1 hypothetical protein PPYR_06758 [Photinus pyralis]